MGYMWKTKDGKTIALRDMTDEPIKSALKRLQRKGFHSCDSPVLEDKWGGVGQDKLYHPWIKRFEEELAMREMARRYQYYLENVVNKSQF